MTYKETKKTGEEMNLEKAYKNWKENNTDEAAWMENKKKMKPRTIQLWQRKLWAWESRKKRSEDET